MLVTSRTSSWVVPPPKVVFYKDAPECLRSERLYCSSTEGSLGTSQRGVVNRVRRGIPRDRLRMLRSRSGAWKSRSSRSTTRTPSQDGRKVGGGPKALSVSTSTDTPKSWSLRVGGPVGKGWGLQPEREQGPLRTLEGLQQHDCRYRTKTGAASRRSCLASLSSCEGVATLALAAEQCGKLICSRILICSMQGVHRKAPYGIG